jgi:hypothetical protein
LSDETLNSSLFLSNHVSSPINQIKIEQSIAYTEPKCLFDELNSNIKQIENILNQEMENFHHFDMACLMYDTSKLAKRDFYYKCLKANFESKPTTGGKINKYKRKFVRKDSRSVIRQSKFIMNQKRKDFRASSHRKRYSYLNNIHKSQQLYQIKLLKKQHELFINELKKKVIISLILLLLLLT